MKRFTLLAIFIAAILALGLHGISKGQTVLYEDFNYTPPTYIGGNGNAGSYSNNWTTHSVTSGQTTTIDVVNGNLSYTGLFPPNGYKVSMFGNNNLTSRDVNRAITYSGNVLYFSVLLNLVDNSDLTTTGDYFMHFGATAGASVTIFGARLGAKSVNSGANYRFMIQNTSGGTPTFTEFAQDLNFGTIYLVVVKYDKSASPTIASLWVNPSSLGGAEPSGSVTNNSGTGTFATFASICLRNNATTPKVEIDEIRIGPNWVDVTPTSGVVAPTIQATNITFSGITTTGMTATWTNGDGAKRVVIMNTTNSFTNPTDGTDPVANTVYGGSGQQVVYNNNGNSVSVTGLNASTTYWFRVYEYNGSGSGTKYLTPTATGNPNSQITATAAVAPSISSPTSASITNTTAVLGGTITADGGASITERGTVWKISPGVTITDNKLAEGGTTVGIFSHTRSPLPPKTQIYFKAYATNSVGTSLTTEASFFTLANEPTSHVTGFTAVPTGTTSINLTWTISATGADGYLVLQKTGAASPTGIPVDATGYIVGGVLGDGTVAALVTPGSSLAISITGLSPATQYSFTIIPYAWDGANNATYNYYTAPTIPSASATTTGTGPATYTWQGADNGLWTTTTNWNPTRFVPATTDILQFNDGSTKTVTAVPTETIGQLIVANNTTINLQSAAAATLTISGIAGTDFVIPAGCTLNLNAVNAIIITIATAATGSISGNMTFSSTAATAHRLTAADPGAIIFNSGAVFMAGTNFSGNAFGNGTANSVIFSNGSTYIQQAGSNPFVNNPPNSITVFQTGSLYKLISNSTPSFSGKTYANFEMDATGSTVTTTGGSAVIMDNLTVTNGTLNFNMTGTPGHLIKGNISVATGGTLNFAPASAGTVTLNGTTVQSISGNGIITNNTNSTLEISNATGVNLNISNITLNGSLKLTNGLLTLGSSNLALGTTATITGTPSATAMIVATGTGQLQKGFATGFTGSFIYPVGDNTITPEYSPVTLNFISGTFATGNYAGVNLVNAKYPTDPNFTSYLKRYWNLTQSGITGFNCNATFQYVSADVNGTESQISTTLVNPTPYFAYDPANITLHQLTASGLTSFGTYTGTQIPPTVFSTAATAIGANTATLNGTVKANNLSTTVTFEYGLNTSYGTIVPAVPATVTGNTVTSVYANLSGLTQNTTYHFRVIGVNSSGTSYGADMNFTTLCPIPSAAGSVTGPVSVCSPGTGYVYSVPVIAYVTTYNWTVPPGAIITGGANTNSITVSYPAGSSSGNVSVYGSSICGNGTASPNLAVTVNPLPVPTITGAASLCVNSGYYTYTTEAGMTAYTWTVSSGGIINNGSGTYQVTVSWVTAGAQTISVIYTTPAGCSAASPTVKNITVNPLPGPAGTITGIPSVCAGTSGFHYSVAPIPNATTYVWNLPAGATITSGYGTNDIVVSYSTNAVSGNITVQGNNLCGFGTISPPYPVIVIQLPAAAGTITGNNSVCEGDAAISYTVSPIANATSYEWTVPTGAIIVAGENTNSITVDFPAPSSSGNITVYGTNYCGNGTVSPNFAVTVTPVPAAPVVTNTGFILYSSAPIGNQWYYSATLNGTGAPISGATAQTYDASQTGTGYYWSVVTLNGCSSGESNHQYVVITGVDSHSSSSINIYPVPNDGRFNVSITTASDESFSISVYNSIGVKIYEETKVDVNGSLQKVIDLRPMPNGVYTVIFENSQNQIEKKIIVNK
jgi:hypothetical protein